MTAPLRNRPFSPEEWPVSGDHITSKNPGTLWERVAEGHAVYRSPRPYSAVDKVQLAARLVRVAESAPSDLDRYALMLGLGHNAGLSAYSTMRRVFAEQLALERAKVAHPAGKGITHEEVSK